MGILERKMRTWQATDQHVQDLTHLGILVQPLLVERLSGAIVQRKCYWGLQSMAVILMEN